MSLHHLVETQLKLCKGHKEGHPGAKKANDSLRDAVDLLTVSPVEQDTRGEEGAGESVCL